MNEFHRRGMSGGRAGFTMIELLAVIAVIIALIGLIVVGAGGAIRAADRKKALQQIETIKQAIEEYRIKDLGYYLHVPTFTAMTQPQFKVLTNRVPDVSFIDPWGGPYYYQRSGKMKYTILSYGPDGQYRTTDDITSETSER